MFLWFEFPLHTALLVQGPAAQRPERKKGTVWAHKKAAHLEMRGEPSLLNHRDREESFFCKVALLPA